MFHPPYWFQHWYQVWSETFEPSWNFQMPICKIITLPVISDNNLSVISTIILLMTKNHKSTTIYPALDNVSLPKKHTSNTAPIWHSTDQTYINSLQHHQERTIVHPVLLKTLCKAQEAIIESFMGQRKYLAIVAENDWESGCALWEKNVTEKC